MIVNMSTSASQPIPAVSGLASMAGLAILAHPRRVPGSRTVIVDAQVYLGPTDLLIGSLRYFNLNDVTIEDAPHLYFIQATFARRESQVDVPASDGQACLDYTFVGDILMLVPLGPPEVRYLVPEGFPNDSPSESINLNNLQTFVINPCVRPCFHVTGVAMNVSKEDATFEVNVEQYVSCLKSGSSTGGNRWKPTTRFFCCFPDSPRYRMSGKPVPTNKRWISFYGYVTGVDKSRDNSEVERFRITVEIVAFCGSYTPPVTSAAFNVPQNSPGQSTALFSYGPPPQSPSQSCTRPNQDGA